LYVKICLVIRKIVVDIQYVQENIATHCSSKDGSHTDIREGRILPKAYKQFDSFPLVWTVFFIPDKDYSGVLGAS